MYKAAIHNRVFEISGKRNELIDGVPFQMDILEYRKDKFHIITGTRSYSAEILTVDKDKKTCEVRVGNSKVTVTLSDAYDLLLQEMGIDKVAGKKVNDIKAPMPGMVLQVLVENGQPIQKGDAILILEAMKMENVLKAPADGVVKKIHVNKGDKVEKNQVMLNMD